jgi:hypothetical protein
LDNEPFCDFECDVTPVEDFHTQYRWERSITRGLVEQMHWYDERADYWFNKYMDLCHEGGYQDYASA